MRSAASGISNEPGTQATSMLAEGRPAATNRATAAIEMISLLGQLPPRRNQP